MTAHEDGIGYAAAVPAAEDAAVTDRAADKDERDVEDQDLRGSIAAKKLRESGSAAAGLT